MKAIEEKLSSDNKLIAKFDGWKKQPDFVNGDEESFPYYTKMVDGREIDIHYHPNNYSESWNWLMPVLEKIHKLGYPYLVSNNTTTIYKTWMKKTIAHSHGKDTIESAWKTIIQFIKWYNKHIKENKK